MTLGSASDLAFMLKDAGVPVLFNGRTSSGILDRSDALQPTDQGQMMQVRVTTLLVAADEFPDMRVDARIVVDSVPYVVRWFDPEDDGAMLRLQLAPVTS